jgi:L-lactate permease
MRPSFLKDYLPVSQQEGVEDTEKLERGASPSRWSVWIRWIPWTLVLCLVLSNWLALAKLRNQRLSNEIFCKMLKRKVRKIHTQLLTNRSSSVEGHQIQKSGISCGHRQ